MQLEKEKADVNKTMLHQNHYIPFAQLGEKDAKKGIRFNTAFLEIDDLDDKTRASARGYRDGWMKHSTGGKYEDIWSDNRLHLQTAVNPLLGRPFSSSLPNPIHTHIDLIVRKDSKTQYEEVLDVTYEPARSSSSGRVAAPFTTGDYRFTSTRKSPVRLTGIDITITSTSLKEAVELLWERVSLGNDFTLAWV
jgi:hypothetical protein